jgi:hypothetical protein
LENTIEESADRIEAAIRESANPMGAEETQIEASFREAIRIAREQKSVSLEKRAEATYAEYRRQKASGSEGRGFRLPLY